MSLYYFLVLQFKNSKRRLLEALDNLSTCNSLSYMVKDIITGIYIDAIKNREINMIIKHEEPYDICLHITLQERMG